MAAPLSMLAAAALKRKQREEEFFMSLKSRIFHRCL